MIFNITGGGGTALNFKIVGGTTAPTQPQENTIWVNTDVDITGWVFSVVEPSEPAAGMVWIQIGDSSTVSFNALKKNVLTVYPISAKQYVSGGWTAVTAASYQGSEWVSWWNGEYFDRGNQFESVTGGWTADGYTASNRSNYGTTTIGETITVNTTVSMSIAIAGTVNAIDLTDVNTVVFSVSEVNYTNNYEVGISSTKVVDTGAVAKALPTAAGLVSIDVSALTGYYYVYAYAINSSSAVNRTMSIDKVYSE